MRCSAALIAETRSVKAGGRFKRQRVQRGRSPAKRQEKKQKTNYFKSILKNVLGSENARPWTVVVAGFGLV